MPAGTRIWVVEERDSLTARIRNECPDVSVTSIRHEEIASTYRSPNLAVVDATDHSAACSSIRELRNYHPALPVLMVSPTSTARCLSEDFDDFIILPCQPGELRIRLTRLSGLYGARVDALEREESIREIRTKYRMEAVIGDSAALHRVIRIVPRLGASDASVLITGDTGTGKELFARAIHYASARRTHPFVPVNCGALPDTLFENELFGHEKGAYTDASSARIGLLAVAEGGSLFLDEVDSLSLASQAKLLRVLQEREYRPLGSQRSVRANVRIIAAANVSLAEKMAAREFRADLYYRLNVLDIHLPSLAERRDDIPILARHFATRFARECQSPVPKLSCQAIRRLMDYKWPGNIRELESAIQRAVVLADGPILDAFHFNLPGDTVPNASDKDSLLPIKVAVHEFERNYLAGLLSQQDGNVTRAAKVAGTDRRSFQRLLRRHGIVRQGASAA